MSGMPLGADENPLDLTPSEIELGDASSPSTPNSESALASGRVATSARPEASFASSSSSEASFASSSSSEASCIVTSDKASTPVFVSSVTLNTIYNCITLGMDPYASMLLAELTDEQINYLNDNDDFNRHVRFYQQQKEKELLEKLDTVMERNMLAGSSTEIRWLLSKLNKKRYGNTPEDDGGNGDLPPMRIGAGG